MEQEFIKVVFLSYHDPKVSSTLYGSESWATTKDYERRFPVMVSLDLQHCKIGSHSEDVYICDQCGLDRFSKIAR